MLGRGKVSLLAAALSQSVSFALCHLVSVLCRWWDLKQHSWVAVKHLDGSSKLVEPELQILKHIADQAIPRTVGMLDEERNGPSIYVMME